MLVGYICSTYIPAVHTRLPSSTRSCGDLYSIQLDMTTCVCLWFSDYTLVSLNNKTDRYVHNNWNIVSSEIHVYIKWKLNCTSFLVSLLYVVHFDSPTFVCIFNVSITIFFIQKLPLHNGGKHQRSWNFTQYRHICYCDNMLWLLSQWLICFFVLWWKCSCMIYRWCLPPLWRGSFWIKKIVMETLKIQTNVGESKCTT
jgi:hypothetical protein